MYPESPRFSVFDGFHIIGDQPCLKYFLDEFIFFAKSQVLKDLFDKTWEMISRGFEEGKLQSDFLDNIISLYGNHFNRKSCNYLFD